MTLRLRIDAAAKEDLRRRHAWYLQHADEEVAERFLGAFDATFARLAKMPDLGRLRHFRSPSLRGLRSIGLDGAFGKHLLFDRIVDGELAAVRVVHGARDLPRRLLEPADEP